MITINKFKQIKVNLFDPNDILIGKISNIEELSDIQYQICELDLSGYYIMFNDKKIFIDKNGNLQNWPNDFYNELGKRFSKLIESRRKKIK